jgi:hypothetical protein
MAREGLMKDLRHVSRLAVRSPLRSVSLQIREYQVTVKVKTPVPQARPASVRLLSR